MRKMFAPCLVFCVVAMLAAPVTGQTRDQQRETQLRYAQLSQELAKLFADKKYEEVLTKCDEMSALVPPHPEPHYNKACALARFGRTEEAFEQLAKSVEKGFSQAVHTQRDEDLASLRADKRFADIIAKMREKDAGPAIEGVRTVEGAPEGGLPFRVRMGLNASKEKPNRLILWLHPSGGSMNQVVEPLAKRFLDKGFALAVLTEKNWVGWTSDDVDRLLKVTLPAMEKIEGIDARKPLLLGYSAGGQVALVLWQQDPARWGGLILDAAYPVTRTPEGGWAGLKLPEGDAVKQVPVFCLIGEQDGGARVWKQFAPGWRKAGIPLRVDYVPGKGHTWLFGNFQLAALDAWLTDVAAEKIPEVPADVPEVKPAPVAPGNPDAKPEPPELKD